jgi:hypothetical protein
VADPAQAELFSAETTWFHVFRAMIYNGDIARMGPYAFTVYCVIKAHTKFSTGDAFPAIETIAERSGISEAQVKRELKSLGEMGYLSKKKIGRQNHYQLREKVQITDERGRPRAEATWDYLPSTVREAVADLKNVLVTGDFAGAKIIQIQNMHIQINNGNNNINLQIKEESLTQYPKEMQDALASLKKSLHKG